MRFVLILWALQGPFSPAPVCPPGISYQGLCPEVDAAPIVSISSAEFQNRTACEFALDDITEQTGGIVVGKCYLKKLKLAR